MTWSNERRGDADEGSDANLLGRLQRGSPEAFEALYDRYARLAFAVAMRVLSDETAAQDAVQDAFLSVWRNSSAYHEDRGSVRTWICTIVRNRAIDALRGDTTRRRYELTADERGDDRTVPDVWNDVMLSLHRERIRVALDRLPLEQRQTIELAYWSGMSQREIGETLRIPLGTVKGRTRLALVKLREQLEEREETWPS